MSLQAIQQYYTKVDKVIQYGGSRNESALRFAFQTLLEQYCADKNLELIAELDFKTKSGATVYPDGTLKDAMRQDWGYWESKDQYDTLDEEIQKKFDKGYPQTNILFEDTQTAILIQGGAEVARAEVRDPTTFHALLTAFVSYEPPEVQTFRAAIEKFKEDLPDLLAELRRVIEEQAAANPAFVKARDDFLELCKEAINPHLVLADIREMIIQHILTEDIFISVFGEDQFHRENNIARELQQVISSFFTGALRKNILNRVGAYVDVIKAAAASITDHHEKQRFLKVVYENFYKTYNPAGADRLGIVYTPNEIVHFIIEAADYLVHRHFGRLLADEDVEILDPATGTGTFITELIEYLPKHRLAYKYQREIHCNEVAILPYYVANLNIEYTYAQKMGHYAEFENICFVDTLDNLGFGFSGKQYGFFDLSAENLERINRQNKRKISVIIGNPPYNANQLNENENNKNREYPGVDKRIKDTYIKHSTAQKTKLYDMYSRFIRWASDRLDANGVIAFITNRSFVEARTFDGFRSVVTDEFSHVYVVDLGGDVRKNPKLSGPKHNVFAIQTGVAISFFVKKADAKNGPCQIHYVRRPEMETARDKLHFLATTKFKTLPFEHIRPDKNHNWLNLAENDWDDLLPIASKQTKQASGKSEVDAIFRLFSPGINTARDEWVIDVSTDNLKRKMGFFVEFYQGYEIESEEFDTVIKWSRNLKRRYRQGLAESFAPDLVKRYSYRPFTKHFIYDTKVFIDERGIADQTFVSNENAVIALVSPTSSKPFHVLASKYPVDFHYTGDTYYLPLYRYTEDGRRVDNITDWALKQFQDHYRQTFEVSETSKVLTKRDIFHYVYAVLHHPAYRETYKLNLKREFPRIPFYEDFWGWAKWGQALLDLHLNYETVEPYPLQQVDTPRQLSAQRSPKGKASSDDSPLPMGEGSGVRATPPKAKLKADKTAGTIELDTVTTLTGVPPAAWDYKLGHRSALEWVLEYHKERKPRDPTIREKFNTYRLADYKEQVIDLLQRVCTVSVETMKIISDMPDS